MHDSVYCHGSFSAQARNSLVRYVKTQLNPASTSKADYVDVRIIKLFRGNIVHEEIQ